MDRHVPVTMRKTLLLLPLVALLSACVNAPQAQAPQRSQTREAMRPSAGSQSPAFGQCLSALSAQHATYQPLTDQYFGNGCSNVSTVRLSSLASDTSALGVTNLGPVTCTMATGFAGWVRFGVDRAAEQILGSHLVRVETFGSYSCRNVAGTSRRSGHATANAIDVSAFVLADGRRISVLNDWNGGSAAERDFLHVVHDSACKRFGLVLGPDYNAAHANHLHLEASGGSYCR